MSSLEQAGSGPHNQARLGRELARAGDLSGAEQAFRKAAELNPGLPGIHSALADVYNRQGRGDEALALLRRRVAEGSPDPHDYAELGQILAQSGDLSAAEEAIRKAAELGPVVSGFRVVLADFLDRQGRRAEALDILRQLVAHGSTNANIHFRVGLMLIQSGDLPGAEQAFRQAAELDPAKPGFRSALAEALNRQGQHAEALDILRQLVADGSTDPHIHARFGNMLIRSNDLPGAEQALRKAAELDPSFPGVRRTFADVVNRMGRRQEALAIFRQLVGEGTADPHVHARLGQMLAQSGDFTGAEQAFRKAVDLQPSVPGFQAMLANVLQRQRQHKQVPEIGGPPAADASTDPQVHLRLGHALVESGDLPGAEQAFRRAVAMDPGTPSFRSMLAEVLNRQGKSEEAFPMLRQLAAEGSNDPHVHARLCQLLVQSRDLPGAKQAFRKATELDPTIAEAYGGLVALLGREAPGQGAATPELAGARTTVAADLAEPKRDPEPIVPRKRGFFRTLLGMQPRRQ